MGNGAQRCLRTACSVDKCCTKYRGILATLGPDMLIRASAVGFNRLAEQAGGRSSASTRILASESTATGHGTPRTARRELDLTEEDGDAEHGESHPEDRKPPLHVRKARQACSRLNRQYHEGVGD
eukprot:scaffold25644_cov62-Phaeocystis_antarctica.AAC.1